MRTLYHFPLFMIQSPPLLVAKHIKYMKKGNIKQLLKERRQKRIRSTISGTAEIPRLTVYRSNKFVYAQLIDDTKGNTIVAHSSMGSKSKKGDHAREVGIEIA